MVVDAVDATPGDEARSSYEYPSSATSIRILPSSLKGADGCAEEEYYSSYARKRTTNTVDPTTLAFRAHAVPFKRTTSSLLSWGSTRPFRPVCRCFLTRIAGRDRSPDGCAQPPYMLQLAWRPTIINRTCPVN